MGELLLFVAAGSVDEVCLIFTDLVTFLLNGNNQNPNGAENMSDVLLSCLRAFDPDAEGVGGGAPRSTTPLTDIIA
mgnify:CR=1 FL=1